MLLPAKEYYFSFEREDITAVEHGTVDILSEPE
jgi:hypothetical protein